MRYPLEPDRDDMQAIGAAAMDFVTRFIIERQTAPASGIEGAFELARSLNVPPPADGEPFEDLLDIVERAAAKAYDTAGPGYLAYVPGGGLFAAGIADLLANATNRFVNMGAPAPALVQLEATVVRWLCSLFGLPESAFGILTSGGSMANFSAVVTARAARLPEDFMSGAMYVSEHTHHSMHKAARIAGFPTSAIRTVPVHTNLHMDAAALAEMIKADRAAGLTPFMVTASAGTVNTGAVDPLPEIGRICAEEGLWFHVDAAYGGFFQLTDRGRERFTGIEAADSITLDPHKGMFLPYGTGSLIVRDGDLLRNAHQAGAHYLQDLQTEEDIPNFADYSPELSRDFRGLRVWLPLHLHGVNAFRDALDEKLDLTEYSYEALSEIGQLDVPWASELSIVAFAPKRGGNDATQELLQRINESKRVFLSSTDIDGRKYLRFCIVSFRTHRDRIEEAVEIVAKAVAEL